MALDTRSRNILLLLLNSAEPVSAKTISEALSLTPRVIAYSIKRMENWLAQRNVEIFRKPGCGFQISITEDKKKKLISEVEGIRGYHLILSRKERVKLLIFALLTEKVPLNMKMFAPRLGVSRPTIYTDFDAVETWLSQHGLKLIRNPGQGIQVEGSELNIRKSLELILSDMISQVSSLTLCQGKNFNYFELSQYLSGLKEVSSFDPSLLEFETAQDLVNQIEDLFLYKIPDSLCLGLVIFFVILLERTKKGFYLSDLRLQNQKLLATRGYSVAVEIASIINKQFCLKLNQAETINIAANIFGVKSRQLLPILKLGSQDGISLDEIDLEPLLREMIRVGAKLVNPILNIDQQLYQGLIFHLKPAIHRLMLGLPISNYLLEEIKTQYPYIYQVAERAAKILEAYIEKPIPEEEIGYLAMHFGAAMERMNSQSSQRVKAVLVCSGVFSIAWMLVSRLASQFPDLEVIGVESDEDFKSSPLDYRTANVIISTLPLQIETIPVVQVSPLLTEKDKSNIAKAIGMDYSVTSAEKYEDSSDQLSITSLLCPGTIQRGIKALTWEEAVEGSCKPLIENGSIDPTYVDSIKNLIGQFGPYMVLTQGVVLLHGLYGIGVNHLSMSLTQFEPPVNFGHQHNDPVRLAFLMATPDDHSHLRALKELAKFLDDREFLSKLVAFTDPEDMLSLIAQKIIG